MRPPLFRRVVASGLSVVLFYTHVLFAHTVEKNVWDERRKAMSALPPSAFPSVSAQKIHSEKAAASGDAAPLIAALSAHGTVRDIRPGKGPSTIVFIQDVHGRLDAQKNIGEMLLRFLAMKPDTLIGLEGTAGEFPLDKFRRSTQEVNRDVGSFFLNTGLITGAEYAGFGAKTTPRLFGLEQKDLYMANVAAVRESLSNQPRELTRINSENKRIESEKQKIYTPAMLALDQKKRAYADGALAVGDYLSALSQIAAPDSFRSVASFIDVWKLEKSLDFDKAERERAHFMSRLVEKINKPSLDALVRQGIALRSGALSTPAYYRLVKDVAKKVGMPLSTVPEFDRYVSYVILADSIRTDDFLAEIPTYEDHVWARLCKTQTQKELVRASVKATLDEKLVRLTLTPQEWKRYATMSSNSFESFYEIAEKRNAALASNFLGEWKSHPSNVAVIIAGGFHSEGLTRLLADGKSTFITVTPKLTKVDPVRDNDYLKVFAREKTPLSQLFDAPKISLVMTEATNPIDPTLNKTAVQAVLLAGRVEAAREAAVDHPVEEETVGQPTVVVIPPGESIHRPESMFEGKTDAGFHVSFHPAVADDSLLRHALQFAQSRNAAFNGILFDVTVGAFEIIYVVAPKNERVREIMQQGCLVAFNLSNPSAPTIAGWVLADRDGDVLRARTSHAEIKGQAIIQKIIEIILKSRIFRAWISDGQLSPQAKRMYDRISQLNWIQELPDYYESRRFQLRAVDPNSQNPMNMGSSRNMRQAPTSSTTPGAVGVWNFLRVKNLFRIGVYETILLNTLLFLWLGHVSSQGPPLILFFVLEFIALYAFHYFSGIAQENGTPKDATLWTAFIATLKAQLSFLPIIGFVTGGFEVWILVAALVHGAGNQRNVANRDVPPAPVVKMEAEEDGEPDAPDSPGEDPLAKVLKRLATVTMTKGGSQYPTEDEVKDGVRRFFGMVKKETAVFDHGPEIAPEIKGQIDYHFSDLKNRLQSGETDKAMLAALGIVQKIIEGRFPDFSSDALETISRISSFPINDPMLQGNVTAAIFVSGFRNSQVRKYFRTRLLAWAKDPENLAGYQEVNQLMRRLRFFFESPIEDAASGDDALIARAQKNLKLLLRLVRIGIPLGNGIAGLSNKAEKVPALARLAKRILNASYLVPIPKSISAAFGKAMKRTFTGDKHAIQDQLRQADSPGVYLDGLVKDGVRVFLISTGSPFHEHIKMGIASDMKSLADQRGKEHLFMQIDIPASLRDDFHRFLDDGTLSSSLDEVLKEVYCQKGGKEFGTLAEQIETLRQAWRGMDPSVEFLFTGSDGTLSGNLRWDQLAATLKHVLDQDKASRIFIYLPQLYTLTKQHLTYFHGGKRMSMTPELEQRLGEHVKIATIMEIHWNTFSSVLESVTGDFELSKSVGLVLTDTELGRVRPIGTIQETLEQQHDGLIVRQSNPPGGKEADRAPVGQPLAVATWGLWVPILRPFFNNTEFFAILRWAPIAEPAVLTVINAALNFGLPFSPVVNFALAAMGTQLIFALGHFLLVFEMDEVSKKLEVVWIWNSRAPPTWKRFVDLFAGSGFLSHFIVYSLTAVTPHLFELSSGLGFFFSLLIPLFIWFSWNHHYDHNEKEIHPILELTSGYKQTDGVVDRFKALFQMTFRDPVEHKRMLARLKNATVLDVGGGDRILINHLLYNQSIAEGNEYVVDRSINDAANMSEEQKKRYVAMNFGQFQKDATTAAWKEKFDFIFSLGTLNEEVVEGGHAYIQSIGEKIDLDEFIPKLAAALKDDGVLLIQAGANWRYAPKFEERFYPILNMPRHGLVAYKKRIVSQRWKWFFSRAWVANAIQKISPSFFGLILTTQEERELGAEFFTSNPAFAIKWVPLLELPMLPGFALLFALFLPIVPAVLTASLLVALIHFVISNRTIASFAMRFAGALTINGVSMLGLIMLSDVETSSPVFFGSLRALFVILAFPLAYLAHSDWNRAFKDRPQYQLNLFDQDVQAIVKGLSRKTRREWKRWFLNEGEKPEDYVKATIQDGAKALGIGNQSGQRFLAGLLKPLGDRAAGSLAALGVFSEGGFEEIVSPSDDQPLVQIISLALSKGLDLNSETDRRYLLELSEKAKGNTGMILKMLSARGTDSVFHKNNDEERRFLQTISLKVGVDMEDLLNALDPIMKRGEADVRNVFLENRFWDGVSGITGVHRQISIALSVARLSRRYGIALTPETISRLSRDVLAVREKYEQRLVFEDAEEILVFHDKATKTTLWKKILRGFKNVRYFQGRGHMESFRDSVRNGRGKTVIVFNAHTGTDLVTFEKAWGKRAYGDPELDYFTADFKDDLIERVRRGGRVDDVIIVHCGCAGHAWVAGTFNDIEFSAGNIEWPLGITAINAKESNHFDSLETAILVRKARTVGDFFAIEDKPRKGIRKDDRHRMRHDMSFILPVDKKFVSRWRWLARKYPRATEKSSRPKLVEFSPRIRILDASIFSPLFPREWTGLYAVTIAPLWETKVFQDWGLRLIPQTLMSWGMSPSMSAALGLAWAIGFFVFAHLIVIWMVRSGTRPFRKDNLAFALALVVPAVLFTLPFFLSIDHDEAVQWAMKIHSAYNAVVLSGVLPAWLKEASVYPIPDGSIEGNSLTIRTNGSYLAHSDRNRAFRDKPQFQLDLGAKRFVVDTARVQPELLRYGFNFALQRRELESAVAAAEKTKQYDASVLEALHADLLIDPVPGFEAERAQMETLAAGMLRASGARQSSPVFVIQSSGKEVALRRRLAELGGRAAGLAVILVENGPLLRIKQIREDYLRQRGLSVLSYYNVRLITPTLKSVAPEDWGAVDAMLLGRVVPYLQLKLELLKAARVSSANA